MRSLCQPTTGLLLITLPNSLLSFKNYQGRSGPVPVDHLLPGQRPRRRHVPAGISENIFMASRHRWSAPEQYADRPLPAADSPGLPAQIEDTDHRRTSAI